VRSSTVRGVYTVQWERPRLVVDITDTMELELEAGRCHVRVGERTSAMPVTSPR